MTIKATAASLIVVFCAALLAPRIPRPRGTNGTYEIAKQGFVYGLPIVMSYGVMYAYAVDSNSGEFKAPFNQIKNEARVYTDRDTTVVTPNSDTPYSTAWLDVRAEPIVLSVPEVKGRYYSVQLTDGNTFNFGYIGSRSTGTDAGDFMVVGPDWNGDTPPGIKAVFRSTTQFPVALYRTQLLHAGDMGNVKRVQAGYRVRPLSAFLNEPAPPPAPTVNFPKINKALAMANFFEYLDFALQFAPPGPEETQIRSQLARIGLGQGKTTILADLTPEQKADVVRAMQDATTEIDNATANIGKNVNGWHVGSAFGDRAFYQGNWLLRAAAAKSGIYGNDAVEAMYPIATALDGSKSYTLTFPAGRYPPVNAFWSITMYDGNTQFLIKNPIDRYSINSAMLPSLKKNSNGSLTLYIQRDSPGKDRESNWLPAPSGPAYAVMRLYWPKPEAPSILPAGDGAWKPPALVARRSMATR
jgi:hypothetical protein